MRSLVKFSAASVALIGSMGVAHAQSADTVGGVSSTAAGITPEGALAPVSVVEGPGIKIGEGTVIHPIVGFETGYVSNVFYEAESNLRRGAGLMRLIAQVGMGSLSPQRLSTTGREGDGGAPPTFEYRADLRATYDLFLSGNNLVQKQGGLGLGATFRGNVFPARTLTFRFLENFERVIRAANFESSEQTNRDINHLQLGMNIAPSGRSVSALLHYENVIDYFEDTDQRFANRMQNTIGLTGSWRFRPLTNFFADGSIGYFSGLGSASVKSNSYPLTLQAGVQTLLSLKTTVIARVGYTNGFYSEGPSFSSILGGVQIGYRYAPTGRVTALYEYSHQDSINANFYRDHHILMTLEQQVKPLVLSIVPEIFFRRYEGVTVIVPGSADTRDDRIYSVSAGARYNFRDWLAAVVQYRFSAVQTDFRTGGTGDDPSYVRHEILAGLRAAL